MNLNDHLSVLLSHIRAFEHLCKFFLGYYSVVSWMTFVGRALREENWKTWIPYLNRTAKTEK